MAFTNRTVGSHLYLALTSDLYRVKEKHMLMCDVNACRAHRDQNASGGGLGRIVNASQPVGKVICTA